MPRNRAPQPLRPLQQAYRLEAIFRELVEEFGGAAQLSTLTRGLLRRAALLVLRGELAERDVARGEPIDAQRFASETALALRILSRLGARAKTIEPERAPSLAEYLAQRAAEPDEPDEAEQVDAWHDADEEPGRGAAGAAGAADQGAADQGAADREAADQEPARIEALAT